MSNKIDKKKSIGEVAQELNVPTHVIRFWESKFPQIKPAIGRGSRRYYFTKDVEILKKIQSLLYVEGYTISGLQNLLRKRKKNDQKEQAVEFLNNQDIDLDAASKIATIELSKALGDIETRLDKFAQLLYQTKNL